METILIKTYENGKMYDNKTKSYVTLDDIFRYVRAGFAFRVEDISWGNDVTKEIILKAIYQKEMEQMPDIKELHTRARKIATDGLV